MSKLVWCGAGFAIAAVGFILIDAGDAPKPLPKKMQFPQVSQPVEVVEVPLESAILTAAFGMEALQPESYERDVVFNLIEVSPMSEAMKLRLSVDLAAAEAGRGDLNVVLMKVRTALAVE